VRFPDPQCVPGQLCADDAGLGQLTVGWLRDMLEVVSPIVDVIFLFLLLVTLGVGVAVGYFMGGGGQSH